MKKVSSLILLILVLFAVTNVKGQSGVIASKNSANLKPYNPLLGFDLLSKKANRQLEVEWNNNNASPVFVGRKLTAKGYAVSLDKSVDGKRFLYENRELFGINNPDKELNVISNFTDKMSITHIKYQQQLNGIKIFDGQIIIHINSDGSIESVNGRYYPTPDINTTPKIDAAGAIRIARTNLVNYIPYNEKAELIILNRDDKLNLAYEVKLPSKWMPDMRVYVSAENGRIFKIDNGIRYDGPAIGTGVDLSGTTQPLNSYLSKKKYYLIDASLPMFHAIRDTMYGTVETYDAQNDTNKSGLENIIYIIDPNGDDNFNDNSGLKAAVSAHLNTRKVYEFYKSHFNRESYDDNKASLLNVVHYKQNYNNAFWNGQGMVYGDGDNKLFSNFAGAFDVTVHEVTHAVTSSTADLIYEEQSGALNESISDAFASLADSTNWQIGEDIYTPGIKGDALRDMSNPHNGGSSPKDDGWQPANMNEFVQMQDDEAHDWGGVHLNSGIPNKAFYNVAVVIGHWKTGLIWYRSLTVYLTKSSQFNDMRIACLNSAKDIFGEGSAEYAAVDNGFNEVGIDGISGLSEIDNRIPDKFELSANYPNPFNPSTSIRYSLPVDEDVSIIIYDITGKEIAALVNNHQNSGTYVVTWNGKNSSGIEAASGVYLYRIQAGGFVKTRKMILMK